MEESTVLKERDGVAYLEKNDSTVVSSVRRDLFRDRSKCPTVTEHELVLFSFREIPHHIHQSCTTSTSPGSLRMRPEGAVHTPP